MSREPLTLPGAEKSHTDYRALVERCVDLADRSMDEATLLPVVNAALMCTPCSCAACAASGNAGHLDDVLYPQETGAYRGNLVSVQWLKVNDLQDGSERPSDSED